jgi:hypothetical protein
MMASNHGESVSVPDGIQESAKAADSLDAGKEKQ